MLKLLCIFLSVGVSFASERERFELTLPGQDVLVGDALVYQLRGSQGDQKQDLKIEDQGSVELGFLIRSGKIVFTRAGEITVPSLKVVSNSKEVGATDPVIQNVKGVLNSEDPESKKQSEPIAPKSVGLPVWVLVISVFLVALSIFGLAYFLYKKWKLKQSKIVEAPKVVLTPYEVAQKTLAELELDLSQGKVHSWKKFYFKISDMLKAYLSDELHCDARESTTSELIEVLKKKQGEPGVDERWVNSVKECFQVLDLVKFTHYEPEKSETDAILKQSKDIVQRVYRKPVVTLQNGGAREI